MNHSLCWGITARECQSLCAPWVSRRWDHSTVGICVNDLQSLPGLEDHKTMTAIPVTPREPLQGSHCASCRALTQRISVLSGHWDDAWGHCRQKQERSDDVSETLTALMNSYNGTQPKQVSGGQLPQGRRCWKKSPCTSECPPLHFGCPTLATTDVETTCSHMTCHQKSLGISGLCSHSSKAQQPCPVLRGSGIIRGILCVAFFPRTQKLIQ